MDTEIVAPGEKVELQPLLIDPRDFGSRAIHTRPSINHHNSLHTRQERFGPPPGERSNVAIQTAHVASVSVKTPAAQLVYDHFISYAAQLMAERESSLDNAIQFVDFIIETVRISSGWSDADRKKQFEMALATIDQNALTEPFSTDKYVELNQLAEQFLIAQNTPASPNSRRAGGGDVVVARPIPSMFSTEEVSSIRGMAPILYISDPLAINDEEDGDSDAFYYDDTCTPYGSDTDESPILMSR
ncbi:hypothetical protein K450DRAFT_274272 [Umbelopsis ramanniana AG]|uniref:Uncharacterized protein n=1 Tax=Umbelopsis ramanniana AG TaxID=1314678 RepID=A0AAD5E3P2_UMBRA|nr:uncharacterized protein K450DRAFT_274272 [Umbelopsis ramanniana AG]KAI8576958.1 hypothetical protein K450DRAFT_274272 [Umbelopsis ramanniana AG]